MEASFALLHGLKPVQFRGWGGHEPAYCMIRLLIYKVKGSAGSCDGVDGADWLRKALRLAIFH